ncbi:MAG: putative selenium-dependent hydroxylase accessory protein YqeC [Anaerolineales bacterium]|nr:putative selenium-dependent hydroxylase accessory protein YqeC [Anaerolineales bacterium]
MNLSQALRLPSAPCLALVGAGGKTTALFMLARQLAPAIVTTTTHLGAWQVHLADRHLILSSPADLAALEKDALQGVTLVTGPLEGQRAHGVDESIASWLHAFCERRCLPLLVEADGSRAKPLKAPADHEPAIPPFVETVVVVAGLSALGGALAQENVQRVEQFRRVSDSSDQQRITPELVAKVLTSEQGGLKNIPIGARRVALLNQADTPALQAQGKQLAEAILPAYDAVVIAALQPAGQPTINSLVHATIEPVAGILLAGGEASRFGQPKQLLDFHGQPFVRAAARAAITAGLSPVIAVSGAHAQAVEAAVEGLPLTTIHNSDWQSGQATSIRTGVGALSSRVGAVIFLLADQPQVTPAVLRALTESHSATLAPIIAPLVLEQRANPVLFDRVTFPDLRALCGDTGGRALFTHFPVNYLPWHDASLLTDVDTPDDYRRLLDEC